uniref:Mitochondrial import inner membrane translocase subunit TIM16 n=1 Tax=Sus scrofa TaxID=9823 RepID=A0A8D0I2X4_PIG
MGVQVVGRAFARALRQEFAASRAAADARGRAGHQSAAASNLSGLSLQEAQQILNVSKLSPEEIQKVRPPGHLRDKQTRTGGSGEGGGQKGAVVGALTAARWSHWWSHRHLLVFRPRAAVAETQHLPAVLPLGVTAASGLRGWRGEPFRFPSLSPPSSPRLCNPGTAHPLTVSPPLQNYEHLFKVNDKSVGGSFYLQSKVSAGRRGATRPLSLHAPLSRQFRTWWGERGPE